MSGKSKIEWTGSTWNPVVGCTRVSSGCDHCYAVSMSHRIASQAIAAELAGRAPSRAANYKGLTVLNNKGDRHFNGVVRCLENRLDDPKRWRKPQFVFVDSMGDLFHEKVPFEFVERVWETMWQCPHLVFQILTKRPERMAAFVAQLDHARFTNAPHALPNVWLGTSVEDQKTANERIPHLIDIGPDKAAIRFLSVEPLLGPVDLLSIYSPDRERKIWNANCLSGIAFNAQGKEVPCQNVDWVIVGGESGPKARPMRREWARVIMRDCGTWGVPFFFKQWGTFNERGERVGKKAAGRLLNLIEYNEFPEVPE